MLSEKQNIIVDKTYAFAVKIINAYKYLTKEKHEYIMSKQLLKSGTSIGANVNEAQAGQSKNDFLAKMSIASKEARETMYWLDLLLKTDYLNSEDQNVVTLFNEINDIVRILTKIVKTGKLNCFQ